MRKMGVAALVCSAGLGVAACTSSTSAPTTTSGAAPSAALLTAVQSSETQNSADIQMSVDATVGGKQLSVNGTGSIDLTNDAMQMTMDFSGIPQLAGTSVSMVLVDGTTYVSYPGLAQSFAGKSWVSQPTSTASTSGVQVSNASGILKMLAAKGAVVTKTGTASIGGTPVEQYQVVLSPSVIADQGATLGVSQSDLTQLQQIASGGLTLTVSVTGSDQVRQIGLHMAVPASGSTPAGDATVVIGLTNYGRSVSIAAPPASQVISAQDLQGNAP